MLAEFGVTPEYVGAPIEASMEVRSLGKALDGHEVLFSTAALAADGIVAINRVKPHTDFRGALGSGVLKMLTIGFGKQAGANSAHRALVRLGHETVIREFSKLILASVPVLCGVAIVEDQRHETAELEVLRPDEMVDAEERLLEKARGLMASLPLEEIDLLIIDEIGKEISGCGMDTNVVGALTYLAGFLTGIIFLVLDPYKSNSFVRFHAFQSIFFNVACLTFWVIWMILSAVLTPLTAGIFGLIALPLMLVFAISGFGIWIFLMVQAYQQILFKLPIVGKFAAEQAGVRL